MRAQAIVLMQLSELALDVVMRPGLPAREQREQLRVLREEAEALCPLEQLATVTALSMVADLVLHKRVLGKTDEDIWNDMLLRKALMLRGDARALNVGGADAANT